MFSLATENILMYVFPGTIAHMLVVLMWDATYGSECLRMDILYDHWQPCAHSALAAVSC